MTNKPTRWLLKTSKSERIKLIILIVANAFFSALSIAFAVAMKQIIDGAETGNTSKLITHAIVIGTIVALQFLFRLLINGLTEHVCGKLEMTYKSRIFSKILEKKQDKITAYHSGELMNRLTSDVTVVAEGITSIVPSVVAAVVRLVCAVAALVVLDWIFAVAFTVVGILVFLIISLLKGKLKSLHKRTQETDGVVRSYMQECIENLLAVKVFSVNDKIEERADQLQKENFKIKMKRRNYAVLSHASYNLIFSLGYIFALIYGAIMILNYPGSTFSFGSLTAVLQLVNNVQVPFMSLSSVFPKYYAMIASAERLMEIENVESESIQAKCDRDDIYSKLKGIAINDVSFTYGRDRVLDRANLYINKGDFVVISGTSGIGKSTLIKLILGVYPVAGGALQLDLTDGQMPLDASTRTLFSYVPQGNMIFSGTLKDNVAFIKRDATDEEIENALRISCADQFISELPKGLETIVGENGVGLSEGQVQRIAIARALIANAPIMLLDEATSALDEETEKRLLNNLSELKDITLIIISHKKSAFNICNRKIKIKDKRVVEE